MIQSTHGISLAHRAALGCLAVARRLPVVVLVVSIAAFMAGTAGTSYAKKKPVATENDKALENTVVVSNFGALFAGSVETFAAGSLFSAKPLRDIIGSATLLSDGNGAAGDAQSSLDGNIAVAVPLGIAGFLPHGFVEIFSLGDNGNTPPEIVIGSLTPFGAPDLTGLSLPQGVAFENPFFSDVVTGASSPQLVSTFDVLAVSNFTPVVVLPGGLPCPTAPHFSLGTITEYTIAGLATFVPPATGINDVPPFHNTPVTALTTTTPPTTFSHNATIGGCNTALLGPLGLVFDSEGFLYVVNEIGKYVTVYTPGAFGNVFPIAIIGVSGPTAGAFVDPQFIAVTGAGEGATIYVTDAGDNSVKIFTPFANQIPMLFFQGKLLSTIKGVKTKLKRPQGIAIRDGSDGFYVVNDLLNSLEMFEDFDPTVGGNIRPKLIIQGSQAKMNFPVGVALPQFTPVPLGAATPAATQPN